MAVDLIGVAGLTAELKQTYDRQLLEVVRENLAYANYGLKKNIAARGGKSVEFRRFEKFPVASASTLTEGTSPASIPGTISTVAATISQYGAYSQISDLLEVQAYDPIIGEYVDKFGLQAGEYLDQVVRDVVRAGTTIQYASTASTIGGQGNANGVASGMYLNAAELRETRRTLARNKAKPLVDGKYVCVIHPDNTKDLLADPDVKDTFLHATDKGGANPLVTGVMGDWGGFRFVETNQVYNRASGMSGAGVYAVMAFGKEAYGVTELDAMQLRTIIHPRGSGGHTDPLEQYSTVGWKAALTAVRLNENWMVRIECNSSFATAA